MKGSNSYVHNGAVHEVSIFNLDSSLKKCGLVQGTVLGQTLYVAY